MFPCSRVTVRPMAKGIACLLFLQAAVALAVSGQSAPPLPRDTLPETIDLTLIPLGLDSKRPVPKDNPLTAASVQLGRKLFFDPILSKNRTIACATCHDPAHGFDGKEVVAIGIDGKKGIRNAPTLFNRAYAKSLFWDGREATLESQALKPLEDPLEMGNSMAEILKR